ncbi:MAG TPA: DNA-binding protein WhiA, partial [Micromonosporaceae bacterium]|nr:DNA-binding protein WhiA [Micromonosporaceae bacterium]
MAMTAAVKDELSRVDVPKPCCRRSEMAALLRFAGGLHIVSGRVVVEAELDTGAVARRLRTAIADLFGYPSEVHILASGGLRKASHYIVRIVKDGE